MSFSTRPRLFGISILLGAVAFAGWHFGDQRFGHPEPTGKRWLATPRSPLYTGDPVKPREDWFLYQRAYPLDRIPADARVKALRHAETMPKYQRPVGKAMANSAWTLVGPNGFDSDIEPTWGRMSGRVRALAIDPTDSNTLFLGTASGGVWRSVNGGTSWTPLTDNEDSLAIGAIGISQDGNTIYAGTGEGNGQYYGVGILKSTNGGDTWTKVAEATLGRAAIAGILVSPTDPDVVVVCATSGTFPLDDGQPDPSGAIGGIYRSTNGGATFANTDASFCRTLVSVPTDFNTMYYSATGIGNDNGLFQSNDAGQTWAPVAGTVNGTNLGRLGIGVSNDGMSIYIGGADGNDVVQQESFDGGATWSVPRRTPISGQEDAGQYCEQQCGYDNVIAVNPFDSSDVYYGGVGLYRTVNGAQTFSLVGNNNNGGGPLHVDHHVFLFDPAINQTAYNGNDGGIYKTTDGGTTWMSLNGTLPTLQPYHLSLHPNDGNILFTGNQDNGTTRRTISDTWTEIEGGDGGFSAIDHTNPQTVFVSTTELNMSRSNSGGDAFTFQDVTPPLGGGDTPNFIAPFVMDPNNANVLYAGSNRVFRTSNSGDTWPGVSGDLTGGFGSITNLAVAPSDSAIVYAVTSNGMVQRSGNSGAAFNDLTAAPLPQRYATSVAVDPTDADTVYVTYSGFNDATPGSPGHVFKTTNGGGTWTDVSNNLPDAPISAVEIRPDSTQEVYVGTDVGAFISLDGGDSWAKFTGLPNAVIFDIAVNQTTDILAVATYGRSVWTTSLTGGGGGNNAPTPQNDAATVAQGGTVTTLNSGQVSLLANDTDPDMDNLTINTTPVTPPTNGNVTINANGTFSYTHNNTMTSTDSFVYRVCDDGMPSLCGNATVNVSITLAGPTMICSTPNVTIPDGDDVTGVTDTLTVAQAGQLTDLDVSLMITHAYVDDLIATLTHVASGTTVTLIDEPNDGNCGIADIDAVFDDASAIPAETECAANPPAIGGTVSPTQALAGFNGQDLLGDWRLSVRDVFTPDEGTLDVWCLMPTVAVTADEVFADGFEEP